MIESKLSFFQVQIKRVFRDTVKLGQATLCIAPERFDTVDMPFSTRKLILPMMHSKVLVKADIDQSIVTSPTIGMDHCARIDVTTDNGLQCSFRAVWYDFGVDFVTSLQKTKHNGLAISSPTAFATYTMGAKVRFINFYRTLQGRFQFAGLSNPPANFQKDIVYRSYRNTCQFSSTCSRQIKGKTAYKLPEFRLANFRTAVISVSINHLRKLSHLSRCFTS